MQQFLYIKNGNRKRDTGLMNKSLLSKSKSNNYL